MSKMKLSEELAWRGFVTTHTFTNLSDLDQKNRSFYWGTDPSADSLHIGHLAALMMCACFAKHGYQAYFLVGGATGQIGDPKDNSERSLKPLSEINHNKKQLKAQIEKVTNIKNATMLDNYDWFKDVKFLPFLREIGKNFSMTQLLDRQFVQNRIGAGGVGISYAEFSYTLIQGYDFLHLYRQYGIDLQLCGADQVGNCASGIHLIKRLENAEADLFACPLILDKVTGKKFGKSEGNAVWLDPNKTSIFDFYQFWYNQSDSALEDYFKYFTFVTPAELDQILAKHLRAPEKRFGQAELARMVTAIVHGEEAATKIAKATTILFDKNSSLQNLSSADYDLLSFALPTFPAGTSVVEVLKSAKLASSNSAAQQLLKGGAISLNGQRITKDQTLDAHTLLKKGKNKFIIIA